MTTAEKVIKNKMGLIKLAEQLGNVIDNESVKMPAKKTARLAL
jgi:hypothetical protein